VNYDEILKAKREAIRFLEKVEEFEHDSSKVVQYGEKIYPVDPLIARAALKRSSLDLWRQLAKMRVAK